MNRLDGWKTWLGIGAGVAVWAATLLGMMTADQSEAAMPAIYWWVGGGVAHKLSKLLAALREIQGASS